MLQERRQLLRPRYWIPGVNHLETFGRWAFAELTEIYQIESDFERKVEEASNAMVQTAATGSAERSRESAA